MTMLLREKEKLELHNALLVYYQTRMPLPDYVVKKEYVGLSMEEIIDRLPECEEVKFNKAYKSLEYIKENTTILFEIDANNKCTSAFQFTEIVNQHENESVDISKHR